MCNRETHLLPADEHDAKLAANVRPTDWRNPTPQPNYNMVVVGGGTAGLISAIATASLGGKVALIERQFMGGDCLNVGCVPSKCLIRSARLAADMKNAARFGLTPSAPDRSNFPAVMERLRRIRAEISEHDSVQRYTELGVDVFLGEAHFTSRNTLDVDGQAIRFSKAVLATGARAVHPDIPGLAASGFLTNETVFNLTTCPEHLVVIGGGPIGCELAQAFRRLGAEVSMVQHSRFLPREDEDAAAILEEVFAQEGIRTWLHSTPLDVKMTPEGHARLSIDQKSAGRITLEADAILIGAGRAPNVEGIGLDKAGVDYDPRHGIRVDDRLRTTNPSIYAAGDCCMNWKFTHAAEAAARIVVQNALFKGRKKVSDLVMPWCTYTDPEIAHVGLYEHEARQAGWATETFTVDMEENDRARTDGETQGFVKVLVKRGSDHILGATVVSAHAGEMISEWSTAIAAGMGLGRLNDVIHPYPTQAEAIKRVAGLYSKSRLKPWIASLLKGWLKIQLAAVLLAAPAALGQDEASLLHEDFSSLAIMCDTDNTGESATAFIDFIDVLSR